VGVARASLEELLIDYKDYLRQHDLRLWGKDDMEANSVRKLAYVENRTYKTYRTYIEEASSEAAANTMVCVINQTNYLLDQLLRQLEQSYLQEGGFTERLYKARKDLRDNNHKE
ncbi:MAG TPA: four helix bundle suffix domain-containing protein, partial [Bacteroidota bacterium]|nr:four helix bundle suffix domain-containing protein [Bacteroidota bacterium]